MFLIKNACRTYALFKTKVYVKTRGTDCKNRHIFLDFNGIFLYWICLWALKTKFPSKKSCKMNILTGRK